MSFFSSNLIIKFRTGLIALLSVLLLQNSADATNNTTEREVAAWLEQMSAVINSRNPNVIKKFFSFYSSNSVQFIKKSSLYVAGLDDPVAEDNIVLNRDQYIKYVYGLTKYPKIYGYKAKLSSLKEQSDGTYLAAVTVEEIAVSEVENKVIVKVAAIGTEGGGGASTTTSPGAADSPSLNGMEQQKNQTSIIKTIISTNCNMTFTQSATLLLLGSYCIEKIAIQ